MYSNHGCRRERKKFERIQQRKKSFRLGGKKNSDPRRISSCDSHPLSLFSLSSESCRGVFGMNINEQGDAINVKT